MKASGRGGGKWRRGVNSKFIVLEFHLDPLHPIFDLGRCATSISLRLPCSQEFHQTLNGDTGRLVRFVFRIRTQDLTHICQSIDKLTLNRGRSETRDKVIEQGEGSHNLKKYFCIPVKATHGYSPHTSDHTPINPCTLSSFSLAPPLSPYLTCQSCIQPQSTRWRRGQCYL
eukprot:sb/3472194/